MSVNLYNSEGYLDTTVYEALSNMEQEARRTAYRPLVFICSPFAGDMEGNAARAREYCRFAVAENCIPIAPHLLFPQFMEETDPAQRRLGFFSGWYFKVNVGRSGCSGAILQRGWRWRLRRLRNAACLSVILQSNAGRWPGNEESIQCTVGGISAAFLWAG